MLGQFDEFQQTSAGILGKHMSLSLCVRHKADDAAYLPGFIAVNQSMLLINSDVIVVL